MKDRFGPITDSAVAQGSHLFISNGVGAPLLSNEAGAPFLSNGAGAPLHPLGSSIGKEASCVNLVLGIHFFD